MSGHVWACLGLSGPISTVLGPSRPFMACQGLSRPPWAHMGLSGPVWTCLIFSKLFWDCIWLVRACLALSGHVWACMGLSGHEKRTKMHSLMYKNVPIFSGCIVHHINPRGIYRIRFVDKFDLPTQNLNILLPFFVLVYFHQFFLCPSILINKNFGAPRTQAPLDIGECVRLTANLKFHAHPIQKI